MTIQPTNPGEPELFLTRLEPGVALASGDVAEIVRFSPSVDCHPDTNGQLGKIATFARQACIDGKRGLYTSGFLRKTIFPNPVPVAADL